MREQRRGVAFNLDGVSLNSLQEGLPGWQIEVIGGASPKSLAHDWNPTAADLVVIAAGDRWDETLGLCRGLRSQAGRAHILLLVLVPPAQDGLVRTLLEAGADSCLVLPVHAKEVANFLKHGRQGDRPGRHTLNLDRAQADDPWRDDGGQG
jgi:DNA-binding NarL/FixJ family response regulator